MGKLLNEAVDAGVELFDTALSYGVSEDRIRRHLGGRRSEILLSTKVGYGVDGHEDWTPGCIAGGIDQALRNLGCDHIDIVHLHSCPQDLLINGGVIEPLSRAVEAGKIRVAAYSGDNDALAWAADSGAFGGVQASLSFVDVANESSLHHASQSNVGTLIKRPLANAVWRFDQQPEAPDLAAYWQRWTALGLPDFGLPWAEVGLRYVFGRPWVSAMLVGTTKPANLRSALAAIDRGPLGDDIRGVIDERLAAVGRDWPALI